MIQLTPQIQSTIDSLPEELQEELNDWHLTHLNAIVEGLAAGDLDQVEAAQLTRNVLDTTEIQALCKNTQDAIKLHEIFTFLESAVKAAMSLIP